LGGLLETITPVTADDGWGGTVSLDTRAWSITISVVPTLVAGIPVQLAADPVVVTLVAQTGKMLDADTFKAGGPAQRTTLTRSEVKALNNVTLASLIAAAKVKLGLT
jgi:nitrogen fixation protein